MSNSIQFNETFYLSTYPDVAAAVSRGQFTSGQQHYNSFGRFESRNPNAFFNTAEYLGRYPDVAAAGVNPFQHFLLSGAREGRLPNNNADSTIDVNNDNVGANDFNSAAYVAQYPDVGTAVTAGQLTAYQHFILFGQFEGRTATLNNGTTFTGSFANTGSGPAANPGTPGAPTTGTPGQTSTLTTGADNVVGTSNNDTINGLVDSDANSGATLSAADSINGGAGVDTLNLTFDTAASVTLPTATFSNLEIINLRNVSGQDLTVDAANLPGATQVWSDRSTNDVTVTNLAAAATGGVRGNGTTTTTDASFGYATAAAAASLAFDGGTKAGTGVSSNVGGGGVGLAAEDVAIASVSITSAPTAVTLTSTGAANSINTVALGGAATALTINATTAFTVAGAESTTGGADADVTLANYITGFATDATITTTGAGAVNLGVIEANVKSVDATNNAGGVTVTGGLGATDTFTGGAGADTVTVGTAFTTGSANGGAGTADRLILTDDAVVASASLAGKITGFEILRAAEAAADTYDLSTLTGFTAVEVDGTSNATFTGVTNQTFSVIGDNVGNVTITKSGIFTGGTDALSVSFDNSVLKNANGVDAGTLVAANIDQLTISSTGGNLSSATESNSISSIAGNTDLEVINIVGDTAFSLTTSTGVADTISAGTFTGTLTVVATGNAAINITSGSGDDSLTGSGNADVINGGAGKDTIIGGAGIDTITTGGGVDNVTLASASANRDTITDFTAAAGGDVMTFAASTATTTGAPVIQNVASAPGSAVTFNTSANNILELSFDLAGNNGPNDLDNSADGTALLAALGQTVSVSADTNAGVIVAYQGGNAYVYVAVEGADANDVALAAADIQLVGTLQNVAVGALTIDNFAAFA